MAEPNVMAELLSSSSIGISFLIQLSATLIGAFVGFGLAISWDRKNKKREILGKKISMIKSLHMELKENKVGLDNYVKNGVKWDINQGRFTGTFGLASTPAFTSAVGDGEFLLLPSELQKPVREVYHNFELYNKFMKDIINFSSFHFEEKNASIEANHLTNRLLERINILRPELGDLLPKLESEIKD